MTKGPKKAYIPPQLKKYAVSSLPAHLQELVSDLPAATLFRVVVDHNRRYQCVPAGFAHLLGYDSEELKGKRVDDVTAKDSVDIELVFDAIVKLGEMDGLWLFEHREGRKLLFHYRAGRDREVLYADLRPLPLAS